MNRARWKAERTRQDADLPERLRELAAIEAENLPRKPGDMLGAFQWTNARTGKVRRWIVRIGKRRDQITFEAPGGPKTKPHGLTWAFARIRSAIVKNR